MPNLLTGDKYFEGQLVYTEGAVIRSAISSFAGVLTFGKGVVKGASDGLLTLPSATGFYFLGVAMATDTHEKRDGYSIDANGKMGWPEDYPVSYVRRGIVAVPVDEAVTQGDPVYCIHTASTGQSVGHFRNDANTDKADLVPGAVFWKTLSAPGIGLVALNLP